MGNPSIKCHITLLNKLNMYNKLLWHLMENMDIYVIDVNKIYFEWVKSKF